DPRDSKYLDIAVQEISDLLAITEGGAFILCTSLRVMGALGKRFQHRSEYTVFVQGQAPKNALLERFRSAPAAVLFATTSFWEGVDVPGNALRLVVIDKLPFDVPTDPLVVARCTRLEEEGVSAFGKYLLPSATLALKQGFGRLIRTEEDRGVVAVLDSRLVTRGYGKVFLRSLPAARRCGSVAEVRAFWGGA
ncbi:MAG: ATP-dependent DNA helicase, partial [Myxococcales bacterium]|nr:ATP-dependent DNA helicase [Myxococcales bacterium]